MPYQKLSISTKFVLCYKVSGTVTSEDYTELLVPDVDRAYDEYGKVRILLDITEFRMKDMQWAAMWQDAKFGMKLARIEKFALICHHQYIAYAVGFLLGATYQPFSDTDKEGAFDWIFEGTSIEKPEMNFEKLDNQPTTEKIDRSVFKTSKYLIALDSAEPARCALVQAMHLLSGELNEEIHLMTVITDDSDAELLKKTLSDASKLVSDVFPQQQNDKIMTFEHIVNSAGNQTVAQTILNVAAEILADYIIIGTKNAISSQSLSESVCLEVIRDAKCPVLVCKSGQEPFSKSAYETFNYTSVSQLKQTEQAPSSEQGVSEQKKSSASSSSETKDKHQEQIWHYKQEKKPSYETVFRDSQQKEEQREKKMAVNKEISQLPRKNGESAVIPEKPLNEKPAARKDEKTKSSMGKNSDDKQKEDEKKKANEKDNKSVPKTQTDTKKDLGDWKQPGVKLFEKFL